MWRKFAKNKEIDELCKYYCFSRFEVSELYNLNNDHWDENHGDVAFGECDLMRLS